MYGCTYIMLIIIHVSSTGLEDSHVIQLYQRIVTVCNVKIALFYLD